MPIERFAPSPSGYLHLGHAYSAILAWRASQTKNGTFLLRIEDLDKTRSREEFTGAIFEDLTRLGISWEAPVVIQSERLPEYQYYLTILIEMGLCYPCKCTRKNIRESLEAPNSPITAGGNKFLYPGTCRKRTMEEINQGDAVRLNITKAIDYLGGISHFPRLEIREYGTTYAGTHVVSPTYLSEYIGDVVLARKEIGTSYHLTVVIDDTFMGISNVTRGEDIFDSTFIHRLLQELLGLPVPTWTHHRLIKDENGDRLAKRSPSYTLRSLWDKGLNSREIIAMAENQLS